MCVTFSFGDLNPSLNPPYLTSTYTSRVSVANHIHCYIVCNFFFFLVIKFVEIISYKSYVAVITICHLM